MSRLGEGAKVGEYLQETGLASVAEPAPGERARSRVLDSARTLSFLRPPGAKPVAVAEGDHRRMVKKARFGNWAV
ncbi:Hypothetical predicted protein [Olea europaea subsp. europaea]|uniref:Uncharacterized protein n=1 Tax=Olea europaea subsp. europaea TaxID=158383 RepID=A0A8S0TJV9_OLEEU|nr:Hypothetical predicted protein [Olea europaea subsp. europaea]